MKNIFKFLAFSLLILLPVAAFADGAAVVAPAGGLPILSQISGYLAQAQGGPILMVLIFLMETVAKLWPSANPQGILLIADKWLKKIGVILSQIGDVLVKLDQVVSAVIPQNLADPVAPPKA